MKQFPRLRAKGQPRLQRLASRYVFDYSRHNALSLRRASSREQLQLELIQLASPPSKRIAILRNPENLVDPYFWALSEKAARDAGVVVIPVEASVRADLAGAFAAMKTQNADALIAMTEAFLAGQADLIVPLAERYRLPAIYGFREFAEAGGLMSYGLSYRDYFKGVARYVDAVLRGAQPANLPVEQPTRLPNRASVRLAGLPSTREFWSFVDLVRDSSLSEPVMALRLFEQGVYDRVINYNFVS